MLKIILVISASMLIACGGAPADHSGDIFYDPCEPIVIVPGDATTQTQLDSITTAIGLWHGVGLTSLTLDPEGGLQRVPIAFQKSIGLFHGVYQPANGEVSVNNTLTERALDITIAHELGHAIGLAHIPDSERSSLMNPTNSTVGPTAQDERQLQQRWNCLSKP